MSPIITLTSDFTLGSPYVAVMKASILSVCRSANLIDICHDISPQDVLQGALVLEQAAFAFPPGTVHLAVVDPGVGTARRLLAFSAAGHQFVGPDNGLFEAIWQSASPECIVELAEPRYWRREISATFHGRDIMGPVAGHLAEGVPLEQLGPKIDAASIVRLSIPQPRASASVLEGQCLYVDSFGTLVSNIRLDGEKVRTIQVGDQQVPLVGTYGERSRGELVGLVGSHGRLEIAEVAGNAARRLGAGVGTIIRVARGGAEEVANRTAKNPS